MQRFVRIGESRIQFLEGVAHDPRDGERAVAALDALRPPCVHLDLTPFEARLLRDDPDALAPYAARVFDRVAQVGPAEPNVLYHAVQEWGERAGTPVQLLLPDLAPPPAGRRFPRPTGLRLLDRIVRREGFDAADARRAVERFQRHYVSRVPELAAWLEERRRACARTLVGSYLGRREDAAAVLAAPEADAVADQVYLAQRPAPS